MTTQKKISHKRFLAASAAALLFAAGFSSAQAQQNDADHAGMDHSKMSHGQAEHAGHGAANATAQWADPGKAQAGGADASKAEEPSKSDANKDDGGHAGHHPGGGQGGMMGGMSGMNHGGGGMGGMMGGGMMGGMGGMSGMSHGGDQGAGGKADGMSHSGGGMMKHMMCGFAEHLDGRLAYLKAELKLTDSQAGAWNAFADAWRGAAQKAKQKCDAADTRMDHSKPTVLQKLSMMENHMVDHLDVVRAQKAAIESLFTALSDEQKKIASETLTGMMKVGMSMGDMMGGGMSGMMGGMMSGMGGMQH